MPTFSRLFLVENGHAVTIRDHKGGELTFSSLAELKKYTGLDLTGKHYLCYEPGIKYFADSEDPSKDSKDIPHPVYEDIINRLDVFKARVSNPYYGLTKIDVLEILKGETDRQTILRQQQPFGYAGHLFYPDTEFIQGMFSAISEGLLPDNHVENWKTADKEVDGVTNIYMDLDIDGIRGLALAYLINKKTIWWQGDQLKKMLGAMYLDTAKTAADLAAVDVKAFLQ